jgi:hypothetical protein
MIENLVESFFQNNIYRNRSHLCELLDSNGSDKGGKSHNYSIFYNHIFNRIKNNRLNVFELGLGTNNPNILSSMRGSGNPGGSLRAWRSYFTDSNIFGGDIDKEILFSENRIKTFFCDQTSPESIGDMWSCIPASIDIIIDDGLHELSANFIFLENSIHKLVDGGIYIIEDIELSLENDVIDYIDSAKDQYSFIDFVKIPQDKSGIYNNNIILIQK